MRVWRLLWWLLKAPFLPARRRPCQVQVGRPFAVQAVRVQDGDSLIVRPSQGRRDESYRVRLYGIDAPERDQQHAREARDCLQQLVRNRTDLMLEAVDTDRYGRLVGVLYYRAMGRRRSVNLLMVQQGLAYWYRRYGERGLGLEQAERDAQRGRRGVWSDRRRVAPWDHRRARRASAERGGCSKWLLLAAVVGAVVWAALVWLQFV